MQKPKEESAPLRERVAQARQGPYLIFDRQNLENRSKRFTLILVNCNTGGANFNLMGLHLTHTLSFFLLLLVLSASLPLPGQQPAFGVHVREAGQIRFQAYNVEQGMPSRISIQTFQCSRGYIWIATEEGLSRYDGLQFKNFFSSSADSTSIRHNHVAAITEDRDGNLWLATHGGGLNRFDPRTGRFEAFFHQPEEEKNPAPYRYRCLYYDEQEHCLWVGGINTGLLRFDLKTEKFQLFKPEPIRFNWRSSNTIYDILQDPFRKDRLWLPTFGKLFAFYKAERRFEEHAAVRNTIVRSGLHRALITAPDELWIGSWGNGLLHYNPKTKQCQSYKPRPEFHPHENQNINTALAVKSADELWVSDHHLGLGVFNTKTKQFSFPGTADAPFPCQEVNDIFEDRDHNLWLTTDNGLYVAPPPLQPLPSLYFDDHKLGDFEILPNDSILACGETTGFGLLLLDNKWQPADTIAWDNKSAAGYPHPEWVTATDDQQYWTASGNRLYSVNWQERRLQRAMPDLLNQLPEQGFWLSGILADHNGNLWLPTYQKGVIKVNAKRTQATQYLKSCQYPEAPVAGVAVSGIAAAPDNSIWVATSDGLLVINPRNDHFQWLTTSGDALLSDWIRDLTLDSLGYIWIGTNTGVQAIDHCTRQPVLTFQREHGLPRSNVHQLATDRHGRVWMGTYEGLAYYDWRTGQLKTINRSNGLRYPTQARLTTCGPYVISGSSNKKNLLHIDSLERPVPLHEVRLQQFIVNGHIRQLTPGIDFRREVRLSHDEDFLDIRFAAPSYFQPKRLKYRYQLSGLDNRWQYTDGSAPRAMYTGLPPGQYTFKVQARAPQQDWPDTFRSLSIIITPPWWANGWAYTAYFVLFWAAVHDLPLSAPSADGPAAALAGAGDRGAAQPAIRKYDTRIPDATHCYCRYGRTHSRTTGTMAAKRCGRNTAQYAAAAPTGESAARPLAPR